MATAGIIVKLTDLLVPFGQHGKGFEGGRDPCFSRMVRNMISHKYRPSSFIDRGLAHREPRGMWISGEGRSTVQALLS